MAILILTSCSSYYYISSKKDFNTDFSIYKTFAWLPDITDTVNLPYNNEIIMNNLKNYFGQKFSQRGCSVNLENPDLLLQIVVLNQMKDKVIVNMTRPGQYYNCKYYYGSMYYNPYLNEYYYRQGDIYCYPSSYSVKQIEYLENSITLNVFDKNHNKLVWTGTARGDIYNPVYMNKHIHPAVKIIMNKYPIKRNTKRNK